MSTTTLDVPTQGASSPPQWFERAAEAAGRVSLPSMPASEPLLSPEEAESRLAQFEQLGGE